MNEVKVRSYSAKLALVLLCCFSLLLSTSFPAQTALSQTSASSDESSEPINTQTYFPVIITPTTQPTIFGTEGLVLHDWVLERNLDAGTHYVRSPLFSWEAIEPQRTDPPTYLWDPQTEAQILKARQMGFEIIATVKYTPEWAQKIPGVSCGPIAEDALSAFAQFMQALIKRYGDYPYRIRYWEIGNEPEYSHLFLDPDSVFGCWGDVDDPYYGGGHYAKMLRRVYPAVKSVNPQVKILLGGFGLDCDPTDPELAGQCDSVFFLDGILNEGGADYFDIVSYHAYAFHYPGEIIDESHPSWHQRGGVVLGKADYLREVMADFGINKPLMLTEIALTCPPWNPNCYPPSDDYYQAQADYLVSVYLRAWELDIKSVIWYGMDANWRYSGMSPGDSPRPAYYAYQFMINKLADAELSTSIELFEDLKGYLFLTESKIIWVLWSKDLPTGHKVQLPPGILHIFDKYGNTIDIPPNRKIKVSSPIYIEYPRDSFRE
jgi:hypothetical protein